MKRSVLLVGLFLLPCLLSACGVPAGPAQDAWTAYHAASDSLVNPNFPAYSFEYPTYWRVDEAANHMTFASESKLLKDPPEALKGDQLLATLSINTGMPLEEMVTGYTSTLDMIQFSEIVAVRLNGRPAVYQQGINPTTGDETFVIAVDMGGETRGLITARMAEGKFEKWEEILFRMAGTLKVEE